MLLTKGDSAFMQDLNPQFVDSCNTMVNDLAVMPLGTFRKYWPRMMFALDHAIHRHHQVMELVAAAVNLTLFEQELC